VLNFSRAAGGTVESAEEEVVPGQELKGGRREAASGGGKKRVSGCWRPEKRWASRSCRERTKKNPPAAHEGASIGKKHP